MPLIFSVCVCVCVWCVCVPCPWLIFLYLIWNSLGQWYSVVALFPRLGWRKVGSLFLINTVSHMSPQLPKKFMQNPMPPSSGLHKFLKAGRTVQPLCSQIPTFSQGLLILETWFSMGQCSFLGPPKPQFWSLDSGSSGGPQQETWSWEAWLGHSPAVWS